MPLAVFDASRIRRRLDYADLIAALRGALCAGRSFRPPPAIVLSSNSGLGGPLDDSSASAVPNEPAEDQGAADMLALFAKDGAGIEALLDAGEVSRIRAACLSAIATDALARDNATTLAIFGSGYQADAHVRALSLVRPFSRVLIWGRSPRAAVELAHSLKCEMGWDVRSVPHPAAAALAADVICTVTRADKPILYRDWVRPGTHVNVIGLRDDGRGEIDTHLVTASRCIVDTRQDILPAARELYCAIKLGLIDETHIAADLGQVVRGEAAGRETPEQITLYRSTGDRLHDFIAAAHFHRHTTGSSKAQHEDSHGP